MSSLSPRFVAALLLAGAASLQACRTAAPSHLPRWSDANQSELVITGDEIENSHATNAWEVIEQTGAFQTSQDKDGNPAQLKSRRGRSSIYLVDADTPVIVIDGAFVPDFASLRDISAGSIHSIRILDGRAGTMFYGTNAGAGAIVIETKSGQASQKETRAG